MFYLINFVFCFYWLCFYQFKFVFIHLIWKVPSIPTYVFISLSLLSFIMFTFLERRLASSRGRRCWRWRWWRRRPRTGGRASGMRQRPAGDPPRCRGRSTSPMSIRPPSQAPQGGGRAIPMPTSFPRHRLPPRPPSSSPWPLAKTR